MENEFHVLMSPQPPAGVERLIRQNDGAFVEATTGDLPQTGEWSIRPPENVDAMMPAFAEMNSVRAERRFQKPFCGTWWWIVSYTPAGSAVGR